MAWFRKRPNLTAALFFLVLALIFMNRALFPADGQVLGGYDIRGYYYIMPHVVREALANGHLPLWDPYRYNGFPLLADPQVNLFYPPAWLMLLLPVNLGMSWYMVFHIWLAGFGMYQFVRFQVSGFRFQVSSFEFRVSSSELAVLGLGEMAPALLAGISFAFGGFLAGRLWAGHTAVYATVAWTPWVLWGLAWSIKQGGWKTAVLAAFPFAMSILAGHFASFFYIGLMWAAFALYFFLFSPATRLIIIRQATIIGVVGLALAAIQLLPFLQFSFGSERVAEASYEFATDYSLPPAHLITLLLPEFFGEPTRLGYWSVPVYEELTYYAGLISFLALILALRKPDRLTWFYILLMTVGLWLALGRYGGLYKLFYDLFPPFRIIRAPARASYWYITAVSALLGYTLHYWLSLPSEDRQKQLSTLLRRALTIIGICGFAALAATGAVFMALHPTDTSGRLWHQVGGYSIALVVLLAGGGLLWGYLTTPHRREVLGGALILLCITDMWLFSWKMVRLEPVAVDPFWRDAKEILGDTPDRVLPWGLSVFLQNESLWVELPSVFGYDALEPGAQVALSTSVPDPRSSAYDVLGVRYVVSSVPLDEFTQGERPLSLLQQYGYVYIYQRARPMPVARLVTATEIISDNAATIARIHQPDFDPATTAILASPPPCDLTPTPGGTAEIQASSPGYWQIHTNSPAPALLVLAENSYPGWQVTVDGKTAESLTAYTTLRAVCVPAGEHVVEWQFQPTILWIGTSITLLSLLLSLYCLFSFKKQPQKQLKINS